MSKTTALGCNADSKANIQTLMVAAIEENEMEGDYIINIKNYLDQIPCSPELARIEMSLVNVMSREPILKYIIDD